MRAQRRFRKRLGAFIAQQTFLVRLRVSRWPAAPHGGETVKRGQDGPVSVGTLARKYVRRPGAIAVRLARAALHHRATQRRSLAHAELRAFDGDGEIALEGLTTTAQTIPVGHCKGGCPRPPLPTSGGGGLR